MKNHASRRSGKGKVGYRTPSAFRFTAHLRGRKARGQQQYGPQK